HAPEHLHPSNWTINESIYFLEQECDPSKPFFLKTSFARPHSPYDAPEYYFNKYVNKENIPEAKVGDWSHIHDDKEEAKRPDAWRGVKSKEEIKRARAGYYGSITHIDHQLGRLLTYLQKKNLLKETMIVFVSDHGDMLGDHNLWRKTYAYEGSSHIPLLVKLPESQGSVRKRIEEPALIQDIIPTILDALNLPIPESVDGKSLVPLMKDETYEWREFNHGEHSTCYSEEQEMQYVTDGKTKYIWFPRIGAEQLFDLVNDPYEYEDLIETERYQDVLSLWRERLVTILEQRNLGLTKEGQLVCQKGKPFIK